MKLDLVLSCLMALRPVLLVRLVRKPHSLITPCRVEGRVQGNPCVACLSVGRSVGGQDYLHIVVPALIRLVDQLGEMAGPEAVTWQVCKLSRTRTGQYSVCCHSG